MQSTVLKKVIGSCPQRYELFALIQFFPAHRYNGRESLAEEP